MSNNITLKLEGLPDQGGHLLLQDFIDRAKGLYEALKIVDKLEGNLTDETLSYRIVDASHSSPLSITLEMVVREAMESVDVHHVDRRRHKFFEVARAIEDDQPLPDNTPVELIAAFRSISHGAGRQFLRGEIRNTDCRVVIDERFDAKIDRTNSEQEAIAQKIPPSAETYLGEIQGTVHSFFKESKRPHLIIRDLSTKSLVRCYFDPMMYEKAVETLVERDSVVFVEGTIRQNQTSGNADEVSVTDFRPAPLFDLSFFESFVGSRPNFTGNLTSEEAINNNREHA